ncbi:unnamed protein product [Arctogadus glacialis]
MVYGLQSFIVQRCIGIDDTPAPSYSLPAGIQIFSKSYQDFDAVSVQGISSGQCCSLLGASLILRSQNRPTVNRHLIQPFGPMHILPQPAQRAANRAQT